MFPFYVPHYVFLTQDTISSTCNNKKKKKRRRKKKVLFTDDLASCVTQCGFQ